MGYYKKKFPNNKVLCNILTFLLQLYLDYDIIILVKSLVGGGMNVRQKKFTNKIIGYFISIVIIGLVIMSSISFYFADESLAKSSTESIQNFTKLSSTMINNEINDNLLLLEDIIKDEKIVSNSTNLEDKYKLISNYLNSRGFEYYGIASKDGSIIYNNGKKEDLTEKGFFKDAFNGKIVSNPFTVDDKLFMYYSIPYNDGGEEKLLVAVKNAEVISSVLNNISEFDNSKIFILDKDAMIEQFRFCGD